MDNGRTGQVNPLSTLAFLAFFAQYERLAAEFDFGTIWLVDLDSIRMSAFE